MKYEFKGKLIVKNDTIQVSDKFKKREFVVEKKETTQTGYEMIDPVKFQLTQDKCNLLDDVKLGCELTVHFNLRGNTWEKDGKMNYFVNLDAWKIDVDSSVNSVPDTPPVDSDDESGLTF